MRRALKDQRASAVFGDAGKRRVRVFTDADPAALTRRISRARLLAFVEGDDAAAIAVWRAGKLKVELELPRVLRTSRELGQGADAAQRLASALESQPPGALKPGTAAIDLAAGIAGAGASTVRDLDERALRKRADELGHARKLEPHERARLEGLRVLESDGREVPLLPDWAQPRAFARARTADALLAELRALEPHALTDDALERLLALASGELGLVALPALHAEVVRAARTLLEAACRDSELRLRIVELAREMPPTGESDFANWLSHL